MFPQDDLSHLPRPALTRIIPSTHAEWNSTKGGSDTITKIVDDMVLHPPKAHTNFESVAVGRCISILLSTTFKLFQIITAKQDLNKYSTMKNFRNAASHRFTFKKALKIIYGILKKQAEESEKNKEVNDENANPNPNPNQQQRQHQRRARFNNQDYNNVVPEKMDFATAKTYLTPLKARKRQIDRGAINSKVLERSRTCSGYPCEVICQDERNPTKDARRECHMCRTKTKWQCVNCHLYFCMSSKTNNKREGKCYFVKEKESKKSDKEVTRIYGKSCFHKFHEDAIQGILSSSNDK